MQVMGQLFNGSHGRDDPLNNRGHWNDPLCGYYRVPTTNVKARL